MSSGRSTGLLSPARSTRCCSRAPGECRQDAAPGTDGPARAAGAARAGSRPGLHDLRGGERPPSGQPGAAGAADRRGPALPDLQGPVRGGLTRPARAADAPGDRAEAPGGRVRGSDPRGFRRRLRRIRAHVPATAGPGGDGVLPAAARAGRRFDHRVHVAAPLAARARPGAARSRLATAVRDAAARRGQGRRPAARGGTGMTVVILAGALTFVVGLLILRPFSGKAGRPQVRGHDPDDDRRRALLRQLRDLDDDLAAGKLTAGDHTRLREPVEREAAAVLTRKARGPAGGIGGGRSGPPSGPATPDPRPGPVTTGPGSGPATTGPPPVPATTGPRQGRDTGHGARRWSRRAAALLALAAAAA